MRAQTDSEARQEWETPDDFFRVVDEEFQFQIDVCATAENAKCDDYIGPMGDEGAIMIDALYSGTPWLPSHLRRAWCNPGFAEVYPWMEKAYSEAQQAYDAIVVVMAIPSFSTKWWRDWAMKASEIRLLGGRRVQFKAPPGIKQSSNSRENCLVIFRPNSHHLPPHIWTWDWAKDL